MQGVERVLIVHGATVFANFPTWAQVVIDAAKKSGSVKAIGKVSFLRVRKGGPSILRLYLISYNISGYLSDSSHPAEHVKIHGIVFDILKNSGLLLICSLLKYLANILDRFPILFCWTNVLF